MNFLFWLVCCSLIQAVKYSPPHLGTPKEGMIILNGVHYAEPQVSSTASVSRPVSQVICTLVRLLNACRVILTNAGHPQTPQKDR